MGLYACVYKILLSLRSFILCFQFLRRISYIMSQPGALLGKNDKLGELGMRFAIWDAFLNNG